MEPIAEHVFESFGLGDSPVDVFRKIVEEANHGHTGSVPSFVIVHLGTRGIMLHPKVVILFHGVQQAHKEIFHLCMLLRREAVIDNIVGLHGSSTGHGVVQPAVDFRELE